MQSFYHVAIKAADVEESLAFYREFFDAEVVDRGHGTGEEATAVEYVALSIADKLLYLFEEAPYEAAGLVESVPTGFLHFGYVVDDVEAAITSLVADGVDVFMEPREFGDLKIAFFTDPSGVRIELIEYLDT